MTFGALASKGLLRTPRIPWLRSSAPNIMSRQRYSKDWAAAGRSS